MEDYRLTPHAAILARPSTGWAETLFKALLPGAHAIILSDGNELVGIEGRQAGFELRDTLFVLSEGPLARFAFLFRKALAESTVADQVKRTGTGVLHVDACRVGWGEDRPTQEVWNTKGSTGNGSEKIGQNTKEMREAYARGVIKVPSGRWPSNVVLVHGPKCRDGVSAWECVTGCPVRVLDLQTGDRPATLTGRADPTATHDNPASAHPPNWLGTRVGGGGQVYADNGGASRYYPQFANDDELHEWFGRLIGIDRVTPVPGP